MIDREVSLTSLAAWVAWSVGAALVAASFVPSLPGVAPVGVFFALIGATTTVRCWLTRMERRERAAFDLGRESVRNLR